MEFLKLSEQVAADIRSRVKAFDFEAVEKIRKAKDENGTFDVIISTEDLDRAGEIVRQDGWELTNYKNNPIVLWGHDYYSLPIGVCTETYKTEFHGVPATGAKGVFFPADINPLAQQVRRMYEFGRKNGVGVGCTTSVGFIPKEFDQENGRVITRAELLEFSFVPVPANQGVGPAEGRAFTFEEAKELGLDVPTLTLKGMSFVEAEKAETTEETEKKDAQAGDSCSMDDGSTGALVADPNDADGPLVCQPVADKSAESKPLQKKLLKAVGEEHERHVGEIDQAIDAFQKSEGADKKPALKDLRSAMQDEQLQHRAKSIALFRDFKTESDKAFDKKEHLKSLREQHDEYETKNNKALDEMEERCMKSVEGAIVEDNDLADWISEKIDAHQVAHKKAVTKIGKVMCKAAFGEEDQADEKTLDIIKEFLAPHIDAQLLPAVAGKIGASLQAEKKASLAGAYEHLKAAKAVLEALHGGLADDREEESRSDDAKNVDEGSRKPRSRTRTTSHSDDAALKAHIQAREIVGGIEAVARKALGELNAEIRDHSKK
jgi:hypothetical protein